MAELADAADSKSEFGVMHSSALFCYIPRPASVDKGFQDSKAHRVALIRTVVKNQLTPKLTPKADRSKAAGNTLFKAEGIRMGSALGMGLGLRRAMWGHLGLDAAAQGAS
jgi:hypothetical protein